MINVGRSPSFLLGTSATPPVPMGNLACASLPVLTGGTSSSSYAVTPAVAIPSSAVIPAKAGIHKQLSGLDPRFRGDDGTISSLLHHGLATFVDTVRAVPDTLRALCDPASFLTPAAAATGVLGAPTFMMSAWEPGPHDKIDLRGSGLPGAQTPAPQKSEPRRTSHEPSDGLPPHIRRYVEERGGGDFDTPAPAAQLDGMARKLYESQLTLSGNGHRPAGQLIEMPCGAFPPLLTDFLGPDGKTWTPGWRMVYDAHLGVPVVINTPNAVPNPRGIVVELHGTCGTKSAPHSLIAPGGAFNANAILGVMVPQPFHAGFGPATDEFRNPDHYMAWLARVVETAPDYYAEIGGAALPTIIFGRSTGGNEALEFARRFPDRVKGVVAVSPYHPRWGIDGIDYRMLRLAEKHDMATLNHAGIGWNEVVDHGWSFMGDSATGYPTNGTIPVDEAEAIAQAAYDSVSVGNLSLLTPAQAMTTRRTAFRDKILARLPEAVRDMRTPLITLDIPTIRRLFPEVQIPEVLPDSPLAHTEVPTLIYTAGPDLEYLAADPYHFVVWALAAAGNPNVKVVFAPLGDHDPFAATDDPQRQAVAKAFRAEQDRWLNALIPPSQVKREVPWGDKLRIYLEVRARARAAALPTETQLTAQVTEGTMTTAAAESLRSQKAAIVEDVCRIHGCWITFSEMVEIADTATKDGYLWTEASRIKDGVHSVLKLELRPPSDSAVWQAVVATVRVKEAVLQARLSVLQARLSGLSAEVAEQKPAFHETTALIRAIQTALKFLQESHDSKWLVPTNVVKSVLGQLTLEELWEIAGRNAEKP